jgi:hypothetical protein
MPRARGSLGAGRFSTGNIPHSIRTTNPYSYVRVTRISRCGVNSSRHLVPLETSVTSRKQTKEVRSNRDYMTHSLKAGLNAWGRHSCLRNAAHASMHCSRIQPILECVSAATALPASKASPHCSLANHPTTFSKPGTAGQRSAITRQLLTFCSEPVATQLIISNRSARRLETLESYRKQTIGTCSNRHKCRSSVTTCYPTSSPDRLPRQASLRAIERRCAS